VFSNIALHQRAGVGVGPFSDRIKKRYGVESFSQFEGAEMMAKKYGFDRETLDRFALESHKRAAAAAKSGAFKDEIVPLAVESVKHMTDEGVRYDASLESIAAVKLLKEDVVISAANASQICDGASAALVVGEKALKEHKLKPIARSGTNECAPLQYSMYERSMWRRRRSPNTAT
jgi:acetyl-CoA C-acetyltransferase